MNSLLTRIFIRPDLIDGVFCKVITSNDDSGRHGVLIPSTAYKFFPEISGFVPDVPVNYNEEITTLWETESDEYITLWEKARSMEPRRSKFIHYHRYPERRITALRSRKLNEAPPDTMILIGRRKDMNRTYECYVFYSDEPEYQMLVEEFEFTKIYPGLFYLNDNWTITSIISTPTALEELLAMFDKANSMGYVKTLRPGDTGVGYTFETLPGIEENNDRRADYKGIEIKTYRSEEFTMTGSEKTNLFLKEPAWIDGIRSQEERVRTYGYFDSDRDRYALFSTVKITTNSHGLALVVIDAEKKVNMTRFAGPVAYYKYDTIDERLKEKHRQTVFIAASRRGTGVDEEFHYRALTYCTDASVKSFIPLVESGHVMLELRMHIKPNGSVKNYGSAFRVNKNKLPELFNTVRNLRGVLK